MANMDEVSINRLKVLLRGERAFGVPVEPFDLSGLAGQSPVPLSAASRTSPRAAPSAHRGAGAVSMGRANASSAPAAAAAAPVVASGSFEPLPAPLSMAKRVELLGAMDRDEVSVCTKCPLHRTRTHTVFGEGDVNARLVFVGEGPGENEDETGRPFVGRAGQLLDKMIQAMGLSREQVYICNVVKCRPPGNRNPAPEETASCTPYLIRQLEILHPEVIVSLGLPATHYLLQNSLSMSRMRGQWHQWRGVKLMPTYHPSYVLRSYDRSTRAAVWSDLQMVMVELGLKAPGT